MIGTRVPVGNENLFPENTTGTRIIQRRKSLVTWGNTCIIRFIPGTAASLVHQLFRIIVYSMSCAQLSWCNSF